MLMVLVRSLLLTLIIEFIVVKILFKEKIGKQIVLVNLFTNPILVLSYNLFLMVYHPKTNILLYFLEIIVVIVEGYFYSFVEHMNKKEAYFISFAANAISYLSGIIIFNVIN